MPDSIFLETYSLYRKLPVDIPNRLDGISKPPISMSCDKCKHTRTFVMTNEFYNGFPYVNAPSSNQMIKATYQCTYCTDFQIDFFIKVSENLDWICKTGQYPAWSVKGDKNIESMLGGHRALFRKGLICESQSYGVAAFAYYRRIVEEIIDSLLNDISDLMSPEDIGTYNEALEETKKTRVTADKIDLVKDLLPSILRPNNMNPLSLLHGVLSEGLHADSDEKCLELAVEVREITTFLASQIAASKLAANSFNERMKSLLDKRIKSVGIPVDTRPELEGS